MVAVVVVVVVVLVVVVVVVLRTTEKAAGTTETESAGTTESESAGTTEAPPFGQRILSINYPLLPRHKACNDRKLLLWPRLFLDSEPHTSTDLSCGLRGIKRIFDVTFCPQKNQEFVLAGNC